MYFFQSWLVLLSLLIAHSLHFAVYQVKIGKWNQLTDNNPSTNLAQNSSAILLSTVFNISY